MQGQRSAELSPGCAFRPVVAVPARNEVERLPGLLAALSAQHRRFGAAPLQVVIVLNNCSDGSAKLLKSLTPLHACLRLDIIDVQLEPSVAHVGTARRLAMDRALEGSTPADIAVITTDADGAPHPGWIEANLAALEAGADLVGGRIIGDPAEEARLGPGFRSRVDRHLRYAELADRLAARIDPLDHDPLPRHSDHTGASLAVRGDVYRALGGMPALAFREDIAFVRRARAAGYRLRHAPEARVQVSARLIGRAPGGMADCLRTWTQAEADGEPHRVESVHALVTRLERRRALRCGLPTAIGTASNADDALFSDLFPSDGVLSPEARVELWAGDNLDALADTDVDTAIAALESLLQEVEAYVDAA